MNAVSKLLLVSEEARFSSEKRVETSLDDSALKPLVSLLLLVEGNLYAVMSMRRAKRKRICDGLMQQRLPISSHHESSS